MLTNPTRQSELVAQEAMATFWRSRNQRGWKAPEAMPPVASFDPESRRLLKEVHKLAERRAEHREHLAALRSARPQIEREAVQLRAEFARREEPLADADDPLIAHDAAMASVAGEMEAVEDATGIVLGELRDAVHAKADSNLSRAVKAQSEAEGELAALLTRASELVQRVDETRATAAWWETVTVRPRRYHVPESNLSAAIITAARRLKRRDLRPPGPPARIGLYPRTGAALRRPEARRVEGGWPEDRGRELITVPGPSGYSRRP